MKASELNEKTFEELNKLLLDLRKEQFNLRMQQSIGQLAEVHQFGKIRKDIARIKTVLNQKSSNAA
jgi:large subunit ribosomal protein L29